MRKIAKKKVLRSKSKGKNIRFSDESHKRLYDFCKQNGYNLGGFAEIGALEKMAKVMERENITA